MAIRTIKVCDLCEAEQEGQQYWANEFTPINIASPCGAGGNLIKFNGLICQDCGRTFIDMWNKFKESRANKEV